MKLYEYIETYFKNKENTNLKIIYQYFDSLIVFLNKIKNNNSNIFNYDKELKTLDFINNIHLEYNNFYTEFIKFLNFTGKSDDLNNYLINNLNFKEKEEIYNRFIYNSNVETLNKNLNSTIAIGDIHGDFLTILNILSDFDDLADIKNIILLGDIFDCFNNGVNTCYQDLKEVNYDKTYEIISFASFFQIILMFGLFYLMFYKNIKIYWVLGNHDINYGFLYFHSLIFYLYGLDHFYNHINKENGERIEDENINLIISTNIKYNDYYFVHEPDKKVLKNDYVYSTIYKCIIFLFKFQNIQCKKQFIKLYDIYNQNKDKKDTIKHKKLNSYLNPIMPEINKIIDFHYNFEINYDETKKNILFLMNYFTMLKQATKDQKTTDKIYYFHILVYTDNKIDEIEYLDIKIIHKFEFSLDNFNFLFILSENDKIIKDIKEDEELKYINISSSLNNVIVPSDNLEIQFIKLMKIMNDDNYKNKIFNDKKIKFDFRNLDDFINNFCLNCKGEYFKGSFTSKTFNIKIINKTKIINFIYKKINQYSNEKTKTNKENKKLNKLEYSLLTNLFIEEKNKKDYELLKPYLYFICGNQEIYENKKEEIYSIKNQEIKFNKLKPLIYGHLNNITYINQKINLSQYLIFPDEIKNYDYCEFNEKIKFLLNSNIIKDDDYCLDNTTSYFKINESKKSYINMMKKNLLSCEYRNKEDIIKLKERIKEIHKSKTMTNKDYNTIFNIFDSYDIYYFYDTKLKKQYINHNNNMLKYWVSTIIKIEFINSKDIIFY